jgi:hypothetical protein
MFLWDIKDSGIDQVSKLVQDSYPAYRLSKMILVDYLRELFPDVSANNMNVRASIAHR